MEQTVLEELYQRYYQSTYLYVLALCKDAALAADLVADAFVKAWLTLSDAEPHFQYWLLRVCRNLWLDYLKHQRYQVPDGEAALSLLTDPNTPELHILQTERNEKLYKGILSLPPSDQELLVLFYFSQVPLKKLAEIFHISPGTARTRLFRARTKLKQLLEADGYEF